MENSTAMPVRNSNVFKIRDIVSKTETFNRPENQSSVQERPAFEAVYYWSRRCSEVLCVLEKCSEGSVLDYDDIWFFTLDHECHNTAWKAFRVVKKQWSKAKLLSIDDIERFQKRSQTEQMGSSGVLRSRQRLALLQGEDTLVEQQKRKHYGIPI